MMKRLCVVAPVFSAALLAGSSQVHAAERRVPGYECMMLNITEQQSMDPGFHVSLKSGPSSTSPTVGWQPAVVIVREPAIPVNGFLQVLRANGQKAWIEANMVKPYHAEADPTAKCVPVVLPNGLIGSGPG